MGERGGRGGRGRRGGWQGVRYRVCERGGHNDRGRQETQRRQRGVTCWRKCVLCVRAWAIARATLCVHVALQVQEGSNLAVLKAHNHAVLPVNLLLERAHQLLELRYLRPCPSHQLYASPRNNTRMHVLDERERGPRRV